MTGDALDFDAPAIQWAGALWEWADSGGDLAQIAALLREGVPLPPEHAVTLADILEGKCRPRTPKGGPSAARQRSKAKRDEALRLVFPVLLAEVRAERGARRGGDTRRAAAERLAALHFVAPGLPRRLTADQILRIVEARAAPRRWRAFADLIERP